MTTMTELEEQVKLDLTKHEGCVFEVYLCTEGHKTAGIGHLLEDPDNWEIGDEVTSAQVLRWFEQDYKEAVSDCCAVFLNFDSLPDYVKRVCINMAFNLGRNRLSKFKNMVRYVNEGNYQKAADEMIDSRWYNQVGNRSKELVEWMRG
jgi:lysozyme